MSSLSSSHAMLSQVWSDLAVQIPPDLILWT
jgi:hypothetical protein